MAATGLVTVGKSHVARPWKMSRRLRIYFYTSSLEKLLQARLIFSESGERIEHFRARREPYDEDYSLPKQELLRSAIQQVRDEFLVRSIFFVEDTSIRIEALSDGDDFPGLRAKEWFSETAFSDLDMRLRELGNDRRAVVKSDIALQIPNLEEPYFFHGETQGKIIDEAYDFDGSARHPWLTSTTFNGWLVPTGHDRPLGALPFDVARHLDFRIIALEEMLQFLRPLTAAANLPNAFFHSFRDRTNDDGIQPFLPRLALPPNISGPIIICFIGHKCAGKTTASLFVEENFGAEHIEASGILKDLAKSTERVITSSADAQAFLHEFGQNIVARRIADLVEQGDNRIYAVSGLRTVEELLCLRVIFPELHIVSIKTDQRIRFERHLQRGRDTDVKTPADFEQLDDEQLEFGAVGVADELSDETIINEGSLVEFQNAVQRTLHRLVGNERGTASFDELSEFHRSMIALSSFDSVATCDEISSRTAELGSKVWKYNTNRALKPFPMFADRYDDGEELLRYGATGRGQSLLYLLNLQKGFAEP